MDQQRFCQRGKKNSAKVGFGLSPHHLFCRPEDSIITGAISVKGVWGRAESNQRHTDFQSARRAPQELISAGDLRRLPARAEVRAVVARIRHPSPTAPVAARTG